MPKHPILDSFWIDEDHRIKAIKTAQSAYWYVRYNVPGIGQRKQSLKTRSKKQAGISGSTFARRLLSGESAAKSLPRITIEAAATARCARLRAQGRKEVSVRFCQRVFSKLHSFMQTRGVVHLDELTEVHLEAFESKLRESGIAVPAATSPLASTEKVDGEKADGRRVNRKPRPMKPRSIRDIMKAVRGLIRFALRRGMLAKDPAGAYELPRGESAEAQTFPAETLALLYADPDPELAEIWRFLTHTCLRSSEFCWLMKTDVDFNDEGLPKALQIRPKVCPQSQEAWEPKHGRSRIVFLTEEAAAIVARRLAVVSAASAASAVPWLFQAADTAGAQRGKWEGHRLLRKLNERLKAAGLGRGKLHTFRHTGASFLANHSTSPMPLPQLQRFLGHARITTTEIYLHVRAEEVGEALRRVDFTRLTPVPATSKSA
jgi:integrase